MPLVLPPSVAAVGLAGLVAAALCWADPAGFGAGLGLSAGSPLGVANLRADIGAFFLVSGGAALYAAVRDARHALAPALVLVVAALFGRLISLVLGPSPAPPPGPAAVEFALAVILAAGLVVARWGP